MDTTPNIPAHDAGSPAPINHTDIRPGMVIDVAMRSGETYGWIEPAMTVRIVVTDVDDRTAAGWNETNVTGWIINTTDHAPYESINGDTITPNMWDASRYADGTWAITPDNMPRHVHGGTYTRSIKN